MGCIYYFFAWPFYLMYYILKIMIEIMMFIITLIIGIFTGGTKNNYSYKANKSKNKKKQKVSWKEEKFEKEADLWGLSKEDRRIAKEERMSPADFIEAEERDDDELFTDEWEN